MLLTTLLLACGADHTEGAEKAVVTEAKTEAPAKIDGATDLAVDPASSQLRAIGAKVVGSHPIDFHDYKGSIAVEGDEVKQIRFEVQMKSLKSDADRLTTHLLDEDFFHVDKFPTSSFVSTSIESGGEGGTHTVTGNLTVRGQTRSVKFPAKIQVKDGKVQASADFVVDRQDFGIVYKGKADNLIQDEVAMKIHFVAG